MIGGNDSLRSTGTSPPPSPLPLSADLVISANLPSRLREIIVDRLREEIDSSRAVGMELGRGEWGGVKRSGEKGGLAIVFAFSVIYHFNLNLIITRSSDVEEVLS